MRGMYILPIRCFHFLDGVLAHLGPQQSLFIRWLDEL